MVVPATGFAAESQEKLEYLVQFDGHIDRGLLKAFGVKDSEVLHTYNLLPVVLVELTDGQFKGLSHHPKIKAVEFNAEVKALGQTVPWGVPHVQGTDAHTAGYTGSGAPTRELLKELNGQ
jgi:subtilisin